MVLSHRLSPDWTPGHRAYSLAVDQVKQGDVLALGSWGLVGRRASALAFPLILRKADRPSRRSYCFT